MNILLMKKLIRENGHLVLEGDETKDELLEAIVHLRRHTYDHCLNGSMGKSMQVLVPNPDVLYTPARRRLTTPKATLDMKEVYE
jgi:hypothetical protein